MVDPLIVSAINGYGDTYSTATPTSQNALKAALGASGASMKLVWVKDEYSPYLEPDLASCDSIFSMYPDQFAAAGWSLYLDIDPPYNALPSDYNWNTQQTNIQHVVQQLPANSFVTVRRHYISESSAGGDATERIFQLRRIYSLVKAIRSDISVGATYSTAEWIPGGSADTHAANLDAWYPGDDNCDFLFADTTIELTQKNADGSPFLLSQHPGHARWHAWASTKKKPLGMSLLGCSYGFNDLLRANWLTATETWLLQNGYRSVTYYNDNRYYTIWNNGTTAYPKTWQALVAMFSRGANSTVLLPSGVYTPPAVTNPTDLSSEGSGATQTFLSGAAATATVGADLQLTATPAVPDKLQIPPLTVNSFSFDTEDYLVIDGIPTGRAPLQARLSTVLGIGAYTYTDSPPAPGDIDLQATARWLPTPDTMALGESWQPWVGGGLTLQTDSVSTPYLDPNYSFSARGGDEVDMPAVIFERDAWMLADDIGWTAQAFSIALVAVLHPNPESPTYGLVESVHQDHDGYQDWGLRYTQGRLDFWSGAQVVTHVVQSPQSRPVIILLGLDPTEGRLLVADRTKSTRSFATHDMRIYDTQLYLGRTSGDVKETTAQMDVLDFAYWDHALSWDEMASVLHDLDSVYGVVG